MKIALTFDAELPGREHRDEDAPRRILQHLDRAGIRATFFVQGRFALMEPRLTRDIAASGHLIGSHGNYHAPLTWMTLRGVIDDAMLAETNIQAAAGVDPHPFYRAPFGEVDDRILVALADVGYRHFGWDIASGDNEPTTDVFRTVIDAVDGTFRDDETAVVLFHTWPRTTADDLPHIVAALKAAGVDFVALDDLS